MIKKKLNTVATFWDGGCFGTQAARVWTWFEVFSLDWICFGNFIHTATSQMENFTTLRWPSRQDPWRFHLVQQNSTNSHTWWSWWEADVWSPRWCGSKEAAHTCDLVHSVVFLHDLMVVSEGAWSFDTEFSWRTPLPQGRLEIQVLWMMIWQIWCYRIMMFHAPVNQRKPMGSTGIHVEPTGNECHKHHDITNPYKPFIIPIKLKPLKSIIQIDRYICLSININHILYILYPCTSPYMPNHIGEWMRPPYGKLPAQMDFSQAQPWQPWTKTRTLPIGASWSQPWGWWEVVPPWFWWTWNW